MAAILKICKLEGQNKVHTTLTYSIDYNTIIVIPICLEIDPRACVCFYVCIHVCVCLCVNVRMCICLVIVMYMHIYVCACMREWVHVCTFVKQVVHNWLYWSLYALVDGSLESRPPR